MSDSRDDQRGGDLDRVALLRCVESLAPSYPGGIPRRLLSLLRKEGAVVEAPSQGIGAQFVVPGPLSSEEEAFLSAAVTKGLEWRMERIGVVALAELPGELRVPTIFCIGDHGDSLSLFAEAGVTVRGEWVSFRQSQIAWTAPLSEAASNRESKRELWNILQALR